MKRLITLMTLCLVGSWGSLLTSCASMVSQQEIQRAERSMQSGSAESNEEAAAALYARRNSVPDDQKPAYIDAIASYQSAGTSSMLRALFDDAGYFKERQRILTQLSSRKSETDADFVRRGLIQDPDLINETIEDELLKRGDRPSAEVLLALVELEKIGLNPDIITLFGDVKLESAVKVIANYSEEGSASAIVVGALCEIGTPEARAFIMQFAEEEKEDPVNRIQAIKRLYVIDDQERARNYLHSVLKDESDNDSIIGSALYALSQMGFNEATYNLLHQMYYDKGDDVEIQENILNTMAIMRQIEPADLAAELKLTEKPAKKNTISRIDPKIKNEVNQKRPVTIKKETQTVTKEKIIQKPARPQARFKFDESQAGSTRYTTGLNRSFNRLFGADTADVRLKIHNSLLTFATSQSSAAGFVQRSYQKGFGLDNQETKSALQKGLHLPYSLHAVIANVQNEYSRSDLQVYALSQFLTIKRKQAEQLLHAYRKKQL